MKAPWVQFCMLAGGLSMAALAQPATLSNLELVQPWPVSSYQARSFATDLVASVPLTVCGFDLFLATGRWRVEVYGRVGGGSSVGFEVIPSAWQLLAKTDVTSFESQSMSAGWKTPVFFSNWAMNLVPGSAQGLAITVVPLNAAALQGFRTAQIPPGTYPGISNSELTVRNGQFIFPPFVAAVSARGLWGTFYYSVGTTPACSLPRPAYEYQYNQSGASLAMDGLPEPGPSVPVRVQTINFEPHTLNLRSNSALPFFDLGITPQSAPIGRSQGALATPNQQTINLDLAAPGLLFALGGVTPNLMSLSLPTDPGLTLPFTPTVPIPFGTQLVVLDPSQADGFALSHAALVVVQSCALPAGFEVLELPGWFNGTSPLLVGFPWVVGWPPYQSPVIQSVIPTAATGIGYLYARPNPTVPSVALTCPIDIAAAPTLTLSFRLYREVATGITFTIRQTDASGALTAPIATYVGAAAPGTGWTQELVPFIAYGPSTKFLFSAIGPASSNIALDDINVQ